MINSIETYDGPSILVNVLFYGTGVIGATLILAGIYFVTFSGLL